MSFLRNFWTKNDSTTGDAYHSSAYHRFFNGYIEKKVVDPKKGKEKIVRIYTAPYIVKQGTDSEWLKTKAIHTAELVVSFALFIVSGSALELTETAKYYQFFEAAALIGYFFVLYFLIHQWTSPHKMTYGEYSSFTPALKNACFITAGLIAACPVLKIVNMIFSPDMTISEVLPVITLQAAAAFILFCMGYYERNAVYEQKDNENADENGAPIRK